MPSPAGIDSSDIKAMEQHLVGHDTPTFTVRSCSMPLGSPVPTKMLRRSISMLAQGFAKNELSQAPIKVLDVESSTLPFNFSLKNRSGGAWVRSGHTSVLDPSVPPSLKSSRCTSSGSYTSSDLEAPAERLQTQSGQSVPLPVIMTDQRPLDTMSICDECCVTLPVVAKHIFDHDNLVEDASDSLGHAKEPDLPTRPPTSQPKSKEPSAPNHGIENSMNPTSLEVIRAVKKPRFPIRVNSHPPPSFDQEKQRLRMRWRYVFYFEQEPFWISDPDPGHIEFVVWPYISVIATEANRISATFLAEGGFNKVYNISATNETTGFHKDFILRVALPIYPYYKVESDVATTEFVRHFTNIPVPVLYAFDSGDNELGLEWILMEKVDAQSLRECWDIFEFGAKVAFIKQLADWNNQLAGYHFNKIGSVYMQDEGQDLRFFIGPSIHCRLYEGDRLAQQVYRGPFDSIYAFYDSVLELTERELENHKHQARRAIRSALTSEEDSSSDHLELNDGAGLGTGDRIVAGLETFNQRLYNHQDAALAQADMDDHENWLD